ncbi:MAG: YitT family protein [Deltaproteobacteria bacterium]|nr:YitT family protein [Deltaproteobacteria bacterium]
MFLMAVGRSVYTVAVNGIQVPLKFFGVGFTGKSLLIRDLIYAIPVSLFYFLFNIPLYGKQPHWQAVYGK